MRERGRGAQERMERQRHGETKKEQEEVWRGVTHPFWVAALAMSNASCCMEK